MNLEKLIEKVGEYAIKCPRCNSEILVTNYKYKIPYYNEILITVTECKNCGFKHRDTFVLSGSGPRKVIYKVEHPGDENSLLLKGPMCKIEIPELDLAVEPGDYSQGYITTIEGLIQEFIEILEYLCTQKEAPREKCIEIRLMLEKARNVEIKYTIVIYDYLGICDIIGRKKSVYEKLESPQTSE